MYVNECKRVLTVTWSLFEVHLNVNGCWTFTWRYSRPHKVRHKSEMNALIASSQNFPWFVASNSQNVQAIQINLDLDLTEIF